MEDQSLHAQRHLAIAFDGSLENISIASSSGTGNEFPWSDAIDRVARRDVMAEFVSFVLERRKSYEEIEKGAFGIKFLAVLIPKKESVHDESKGYFYS